LIIGIGKDRIVGLTQHVHGIEGHVRVQVHAKIEKRRFTDAQAAGYLISLTAMRAGRDILQLFTKPHDRTPWILADANSSNQFYFNNIKYCGLTACNIQNKRGGNRSPHFKFNEL